MSTQNAVAAVYENHTGAEAAVTAFCGVIVTNVEPLGVAARASIQVKDVIVSVQDQNVENVGDFRSLLKKYDLKDGVRLGVRTGAMQRFVFIQTGEEEARRPSGRIFSGGCESHQRSPHSDPGCSR